MGQDEDDRQLTWLPVLPVFLSLPVPPPVTRQPGCPHESAPLPHLRAPPELHRPADANEPHRPTADADGAPRPPQRLLVDAEHHRLVGRVQVQPDDVADLLDKEWIG